MAAVHLPPLALRGVRAVSAPGDSARGPCLKCTASALAALTLGAWLTVVFVRAARAVVRREGALSAK